MSRPVGLLAADWLAGAWLAKAAGAVFTGCKFAAATQHPPLSKVVAGTPASIHCRPARSAVFGRRAGTSLRLATKCCAGRRNCGFKTRQQYWLCPSCQQWGDSWAPLPVLTAVAILPADYAKEYRCLVNTPVVVAA
nr:hypothetical protein [Arsukibacterium sp.]